jgi:hypothetical protein
MSSVYRQTRVQAIFWFAFLPYMCLDQTISADDTSRGNGGKGERVTRIFWQDKSTETLFWGEVFRGDSWLITASPVKGFPKLDVERQDLVQMEQAEGKLLVGVRDNDNGKFQSGWVAVDTGVTATSHGNHFDWNYNASPSIHASRLNAEQGNPAHLYTYDGHFYLANDSRNGFTKLNPADIRRGATDSIGTFFQGGGQHITLAAVKNKVCYSTWIDRDGPSKGQVDVVNLATPNSGAPAYSFHLPTGGIHGATENSEKLFFAPTDGVCWVKADLMASGNAEKTEVHHVSLGKNSETGEPLRTGAFVNHRNWVLFTTGKGEQSALCLMDASAAEPAIVRLPINVPEGLSLVTPEIVLAAGGKRYAFLFQDRRDGDMQEFLTVVNLDPNGDRNLSDATIVKTLEVGASQVEGHSGHHGIAFDSEGRYACISNPGDGTIWVLTLKDLTIQFKSLVGGVPTAINAIGAASHHH